MVYIIRLTTAAIKVTCGDVIAELHVLVVIDNDLIFQGDCLGSKY